MAKLTPMMAQYKAIKEKYSDCILMYRLGDFYEMFFEDAVEASGILQIALTARNKGGDGKAPMCGIPYHAVDQYLPKLTRAGKKVAICDQMTEPDGKGIVERDVVRVVTPGTTFDDNILEEKANNFVSCVVCDGGDFGFAYADVTTGDFKVSEFSSFADFVEEFKKIRPAECICDESFMKDARLKELFVKSETHNFPYTYVKDASASLKESFEIKSLKIFGLEGKNLAVAAAGMLYEYLKETQKTDLKHMRKIRYYEVSDFMPLDEAAVRNLELFYTSRGKREGSLIWVLDNTVTSMGGRMLKNWLLHPLLKRPEIEARLEAVSVFVGDSSLLREVREVLGGMFDIERLLSRLSLGTGNARDLVALKQCLEIIPEIKNLISNVKEFSELCGNLHLLKDLVDLIEKAICDEAPVSVREGGMIKPGYNSELDDLRSVSMEGKSFIKNLQEREAKRTGISSLKVKFNKVFGYYIEISKSNLHAVPDDYIRKQTLVNAERFIIPELKEYEEKVLNAEDRIKELEYELFYEVRMEVVKEIVKIQEIARAVAELDLYACFAFNAEKNGYCRPEISENGELAVKEGRHPVIEKVGMGGSAGAGGGGGVDFVPNDCEMGSDCGGDREGDRGGDRAGDRAQDRAEDRAFLLITGPNMGGKSTFLRAGGFDCFNGADWVICTG
jgi:DNA mismatch repair protein MutS